MPNVEAPILLRTAILSNKKINKAASIVFIVSRSYDAPSIGNATNSASKGAIISYAKYYALELTPRLIRVNDFCLCMVWTDLIINDSVGEKQLKQSQ
jgi:NAD(P)-dependent dehydrogenase (short-subunit alcohol dehydrogenase family)